MDDEIRDYIEQSRQTAKAREVQAGIPSEQINSGLTPEQLKSRRALEREFGGAIPSTFTPESAKRTNERFHIQIFDRDGNLRHEHAIPTNSYNKETHAKAYADAKKYLSVTIRRKRWDGDATLTHRYQLKGDPRNESHPSAFYTNHIPNKTGKFRLRFVGAPQYPIVRPPELLAVPIPLKTPIEETPPSNGEAAGYAGKESQVRKQAIEARWGRGS